MGVAKHRNCKGCGKATPIGDVVCRGGLKHRKYLCPECAARFDASQPTMADLLSHAIPHVPSELRRQIEQLVPAAASA